MFNQHYFIDALETVLTWNLSDDVLPIAVGDQIKLLAGFDTEETWVGQYD
jgi:hypothetical protein